MCVVSDIAFQDAAWLHRRHRPTMLFKPHALSGRLVHKTRYGTIYAIFSGLEYGKPLWIARLCAGSWVTWESRLSAERIEFSSGAYYLFPNSR